MRAQLWGTGAHEAGWHSWRRMGAALLAWAGAALTVIAVWGRWTSTRYYSSPPLAWNVKFPIDLPWPCGTRRVELRPPAAFQLWPENLLALVQGTLTECPPVAMDGDDSDDAPRPPVPRPRSWLLGATRPVRRVCTLRQPATPVSQATCFCRGQWIARPDFVDGSAYPSNPGANSGRGSSPHRPQCRHSALCRHPSTCGAPFT